MKTERQQKRSKVRSDKRLVASKEVSVTFHLEFWPETTVPAEGGFVDADKLALVQKAIEQLSEEWGYDFEPGIEVHDGTVCDVNGDELFRVHYARCPDGVYPDIKYP